MSPEQFFELFLQELQDLPALFHYYKFHTSEKRFGFRKNYFLERLRYIDKHIVQQVTKDSNAQPIIWDCGCGYGTTAFYLAMNGIKVHGTTLEFYYPYITQRKNYWQKYGDTTLFTASYEDLYEQPQQPNSIDIIIVQDTLHHLEPLEDALKIFNTALRPNGKLIAIEENGDNIVQTIKLYKQRGNKRVITIWDDMLQKKITMGNENIRGLATWENLFNNNNWHIKKEATSFIRYYFPQMFNTSNGEELLIKERNKQSAFLKKYFFFGINFIAEKSK